MKFKESQKLELKESLSLKEEIETALSAFSNSRGGRILIGVTDKGEIKGVQLGKQTVTNLANYIKQNTDPSLYPEIHVKKTRRKDIIEIKVIESYEKPVFFQGKAYKRVGNTSQKISLSEVKSLLRTSEKLLWDQRVCREATAKDVDMNSVKENFMSSYEMISKRRVTGRAPKILESLGCSKNGKPTNAGALPPKNQSVAKLNLRV